MVDEPSVYPQTLNLDSWSHSINLSWVHIDLRFCSELECGIYKSKASWTTLIPNIDLVPDIPWGFCLNKDTQFNWIFKIYWSNWWVFGYHIAKTPRRYKVRFTGGISGKSWANPKYVWEIGYLGWEGEQTELSKRVGGCKLPTIHRAGWIQRENLPA